MTPSTSHSALCTCPEPVYSGTLSRSRTFVSDGTARQYCSSRWRSTRRNQFDLPSSSSPVTQECGNNAPCSSSISRQCSCRVLCRSYSSFGISARSHRAGSSFHSCGMKSFAPTSAYSVVLLIGISDQRKAISDGLGVFAMPIGEQPAHKHEGVLASFASRQQIAERSEKFFQPLVRPGKATFRNLSILFNFTISRSKSRFHDNPMSPNARVYNKMGNLVNINPGNLVPTVQIVTE